MKRSHLLTFAATIQLIVGCESVPTIPNQPYGENDPGWQIFPTPRSFDGVGTVFSIDPDGVKRHEGRIAVSGPNQGGDEELPAIKVTRIWNPRLILGFLGISPDSTTNEAKSTSNVVLEFQEVKRDQYGYTDSIAPGLRELKFEPQSNYRYFVIEAVRSATAAKIVANSERTVTIALKAKIGNIATDPSISGNNTSNITIDKKFSQRLNVQFLCREIRVSGLGGAPGANIQVASEPSRDVEWTSEMSAP